MTSHDVTTLLALPLATYYVTWVITRSKIAAGVIERWQTYWESRWIQRHAEDDEHAALLWSSNTWRSKLAYLPTCAWCTGYWINVAMMSITLPFTAIPVWPLWPLILLASTTLVGIIDSLTHREA